ncbi:MAG TPA: hypothetical protein VGP22_00220, partial [Albitalea sp.]|nr:hypothetical protein [Albitalea sp.]
MNADFDPHAPFEPAPSLLLHVAGCSCALHARRRFGATLLAAGGALALPRWARADGVVVGDRSSLAGLVPAEDIEQAATQQYRQMLQQAAQKHALAPENHPQVVRLRAIAQRLIPHVTAP